MAIAVFHDYDFVAGLNREPPADCDNVRQRNLLPSDGRLEHVLKANLPQKFRAYPVGNRIDQFCTESRPASTSGPISACGTGNG